MMSEERRVVSLMAAALECSVYLAPNDPGLTYEELLEAGSRLGLQKGEMSDAMPAVPIVQEYGSKLLPDATRVMAWLVLSIPQEPDYRDWDASEFVHKELKAAVRAHGTAAAKLERSMLVERAVARGISKVGVEAAITIDVLHGHFTETDGTISYVAGREKWPLPSIQRKPSPAGPHGPNRSESRARAYPVVKDIIERRSDGRPSSIEPLDAFAEQLDKLGHGPFRLWWKQTVAELRQGDVQSMPVSVTVLSAALVEGALTFVVQHARARGKAVFASPDFAEAPRKWKVEKLIESAARGGAEAILDHKLRPRVEWLILARQRIHAGRMLTDHPGGAPDYLPENAREAKAIADLTVRRVLAWLAE